MKTAEKISFEWLCLKFSSTLPASVIDSESEIKMLRFLLVNFKSSLMLIVLALSQEASKRSDRREDIASSVCLASMCADCFCVRGGEGQCI